MIPYILHVALLISVCLCFYKLLLRKETFYRLNRFVLLSIVALSFIVPFVPVPQQWSFVKEQETVFISTPAIKNDAPSTDPADTKTAKQNIQQHASVEPNASAQTIAGTTFSWSQILSLTFFLYWIGVLIFCVNFLLQLIVLLYQSWSKPVIKDGYFKIIELDGDKAPCSFANYIFINPAKYDWNTYNQILLHEKTHIEQRHSFDIILAELLVIFQWFNPFAWLYRKELENNLEFLTDNSLLEKHGVEKESYQLSLLKVSAPHFSLGLTTNYNQSILQKRIVMMNAKKSNLNTMWKYFFLLPLIGVLMCALNDTVAYGQTKNKENKANTSQHKNNSVQDRSSGSWFATIKGEKVRMQFTSDDAENWNSNSDFLVSEFSSLPKNGPGEFTLTREAGTMTFKGKFDGDKGYGDYKFTPNNDFNTALKNAGIKGVEEDDSFAFFLINIKKDYIKMLRDNGYANIDKDQLISMAALKVDAAFINMWKQNGFKNLSTEDLVSAKAMGIDNDYVADIRKAGYNDITLEQIISFKAQNITGDYINKLKQSKVWSKESSPNPEDISSYKALNIDEDFIKSYEAIGMKGLTSENLTSLKATNTTPEFVKSFMDLGYKDIDAENAVSLKSVGVTPDFIKGFQSMGFKDLSLDDMISAKATGVNSDYIKSFTTLGFSSNKLEDYVPLKSLGITPDFVNGFKKLGFTNISMDDLPALKSTGVTPEFVKSMQDKGIKLSSLDKYIQLKTAME
jgi:beta-lactamase regulating signal transducer with metallopeptidase domain